jgi:hypothetical protein
MITALSEAVRSAKGSNDRSAIAAAVGLQSPPTNQQIIDAAQKAYGKFQNAVDAATMALVNVVSSGSFTNDILALGVVNWQSPGITDSVVTPFYDSADVKTAITAAVAFPQLNSFSVGDFVKSLPQGSPGTIGFDRDIRGSHPKTNGLVLTLDIFSGIVKIDPNTNLQFGVWMPQAGALHEKVIGFYTSVSVQNVDINLKILLTDTLEAQGFVVSAGALVVLPVTSGVFAGETASPVF